MGFSLSYVIPFVDSRQSMATQASIDSILHMSMDHSYMYSIFAPWVIQVQVQVWLPCTSSVRYRPQRGHEPLSAETFSHSG